jgi:NitT/TauT family transport system ATP-binding protein
MRQRVSIARAFAVDPEILLCDEPFSALDEMTARDLRSEFGRLVRQNGKTAVFVTHSISEALQVGDRVLLFHRPARIALEADIARDADVAAQDDLQQRILQAMTASAGGDAVADESSGKIASA